MKDDQVAGTEYLSDLACPVAPTVLYSQGLLTMSCTDQEKSQTSTPVELLRTKHKRSPMNVAGFS